MAKVRSALQMRLELILSVSPFASPYFPFIGVYNFEQWREDAGLWTRVSCFPIIAPFFFFFFFFYQSRGVDTTKFILPLHSFFL